MWCIDRPSIYLPVSPFIYVMPTSLVEFWNVEGLHGTYRSGLGDGRRGVGGGETLLFEYIYFIGAPHGSARRGSVC